MRGEWNHNLHYHRVVLDAVPSPCRRALDAGCGEGLLVRELAARCERVTGIDLSAETIAAARTLTVEDSQTEFLVADAMTYPFPEGSFDLIAAVATLHHLPLRPALTRFRALLAPGGVLVVVGLYRPRGWRDHALALVGLMASLMVRRLRGYSGMNAPMSEPTETLAEIRETASALLPGADFRRRLYFRYTLVWRRPPDPAS